MGNLTNASMPVMKARPVVSEYLSSREIFIGVPQQHENLVILMLSWGNYVAIFALITG
jgi:hypothetical protein